MRKRFVTGVAPGLQNQWAAQPRLQVRLLYASANIEYVKGKSPIKRLALYCFRLVSGLFDENQCTCRQ